MTLLTLLSLYSHCLNTCHRTTPSIYQFVVVEIPLGLKKIKKIMHCGSRNMSPWWQTINMAAVSSWGNGLENEMTAQVYKGGLLYKAVSLEWAALVLVWNALWTVVRAVWLLCCCAQRVFQVLVMLMYAVQLSLHGISIAVKAVFLSIATYVKSK